MTAAVEGPLLALDASTDTASVAVGAGGDLLAELSLTSAPRSRARGRGQPPGGHSAGLLPAIDHALRSAGLEPSDLRGVVVGGGPGSFTGLRIAGATAKGLVHARGVPLLAYSSLLALATQAWSSERPVWALLDARNRDVFAACYRFGGTLEVLHRPAARPVDEVVRELASMAGAICLGDGAARHADELAAAGARIGPPELGAPRAAGLLWLARAFPELGRVADPAAWEPDYLRASGAERIAAARAKDRPR